MDTALRVTDGLYERDEFAWLGEQVRALREGRVGDLDRDSLAEFLEDMAASQRRELISRLEVLLTHRLKIEIQPIRHTLSWNLTIFEQQNRIADLLDDSPSLRRYGPEAVVKALSRAKKQAVAETGAELSDSQTTFALRLPWSLDDLLAYEPPDPPERDEDNISS